jgi:2-polyprenyl-3-methyl-5-hydroxy-6-metoxy-1,4-benzoquinol methylase
VSKKITQYLDQHEYPRLFFRFPLIVRLVYAVNYILTLRNWYVKRALQKLERKQSSGFLFLDAGCGMGDYALGVAKRNSHAHVLGIDFTVSNISLAKHIAQSMNLPNIEFSVGDLAALGTDNRYDLILCNSVLQFIKEDTRALRNLHDMLKPTGTLILYVPVRYYRYFKYSEVIERKYLSDFFYKYHNDFLMHRYTEDKVCEKIRQEGFNIRSSEHAYGACGALAFELYSFILVLVKKLPVVVSLPVAVLYAFVVFPIQLLLMIEDYLLPHSIGNGLLIVAEKIHQVNKE